VFVVASAREDFDPTEVLFEFEGLRRDTAPSRQARKVTPTISSSGTGVSRVGFNCEDEWFIETPVIDSYTPSSIGGYREGVGTLRANGGDIGGGSENLVAARMVSFGEYSVDGTASSMKARDWKDATDLVAQPIAFTTEQTPKFNSDQALTLTKSESKHNQCVAQPVAFNIAPGKGELKDDIHVTDAHISKTIDASGSNPSMHQGGAAIVSPTLTASNDPSRSPQSTEVTNQVAAIHAVSMAVRRLTPTECERLQGFPDGYTNIPWRKAAESPDGPRYKALGNSWAVPVVAWIGKRIQERITT
jgi:DNA (cytosine-5)-methyltransferase 1